MGLGEHLACLVDEKGRGEPSMWGCKGEMDSNLIEGNLIDGVQCLPRIIIGHSKIPCYACYCTTILLSVVRDRSWWWQLFPSLGWTYSCVLNYTQRNKQKKQYMPQHECQIEGITRIARCHRHSSGRGSHASVERKKKRACWPVDSLCGSDMIPPMRLTYLSSRMQTYLNGHPS